MGARTSQDQFEIVRNLKPPMLFWGNRIINYNAKLFHLFPFKMDSNIRVHSNRKEESLQRHIGNCDNQLVIGFFYSVLENLKFLQSSVHGSGLAFEFICRVPTVNWEQDRQTSCKVDGAKYW